MRLQPEVVLRLEFLIRVVQKECAHLLTTDRRLFADELTPATILTLDENPDMSERVEALVGRFGWLQDTLGDKLLPLVLSSLGEKNAALIDNLDRAEYLGLLVSTDNWLTMRNLRNQKVGTASDQHGATPTVRGYSPSASGSLSKPSFDRR